MKNINSIKKNEDFQSVYRQRRSFGNRFLIMYAAENNRAESRIGIAVSKKVGNSIVRHHITRLIRESYRLNKDRLKGGYDFVIVARPAAKEEQYQSIESAYLNLLKRHRLLLEDQEI